MALIKKTNYHEVEIARFGKFNIADNSSVVVYRLGNTIIDSGPPNQWKEVKDYLVTKDIKQVVLTHHHEDHSGNSARIANHFGVPVFCHESGIDPIQKGFPLKLYQKIFWGKPKKLVPRIIPETIDTGDGHVLKSIHTPGHSPDHLCFLEPDKKWLFTGDLFIATRPKLFRADEDLAGEIESLKTILTCDFQTVFCAHKGIVENGYSMIQDKLSYFLELVSKVKGMHLKGDTSKEITRTLFGKKDTAGLISFRHICFENLVKECLRV